MSEIIPEPETGRNVRIWKAADELERARRKLAASTRIKTFALLAIAIATTVFLATLLASVRTGRWPLLPGEPGR